MRSQDTRRARAGGDRRADVGNVDTALAAAAHVVSQTYTYPYNGHLPIGPSCCRRRRHRERRAGLLELAEHLLDPHRASRQILGFTASNQVRVSYYEGSSVFGSSPYTDVAESAAVMSQLAGAPVRAAVHALGRARLGQLRAGADDGHPAAASTRTGTSSRPTATEFAIPYYTTTRPRR